MIALDRDINSSLLIGNAELQATAAHVELENGVQIVWEINRGSVKSGDVLFLFGGDAPKRVACVSIRMGAHEFPDAFAGDRVFIQLDCTDNIKPGDILSGPGSHAFEDTITALVYSPSEGEQNCFPSQTLLPIEINKSYLISVARKFILGTIRSIETSQSSIGNYGIINLKLEQPVAKTAGASVLVWNDNELLAAGCLLKG